MANRRHLAKLEGGKEAWNQWRAANPTVKPDLRGANMRGKHLEGFDFSHADIRGTNFKAAHLEGANFTKVTAGLQEKWQIFLVIIAVLFLATSGFFSIWLIVSIALLSDFDNTNTNDFNTSLVCLIALVIFFIYTLRKGLMSGTVFGALVLVVAFAVDVAEAFTLSRSFILTIATGITNIGLFAFSVVATAGSIFNVVTASFAFAVNFAVVGSSTFAITIIIAGVTVFVIYLLFAEAITGVIDITFTFAFAGVSVVIFIILLFGAYLSWRSFGGDQRDSWIRKVGVAFGTMGSTSFYDADLSGADFSHALLKNTDLRAKSLTRTCWTSAKKLDLARLGSSILSQANVRELLITRDGYKKSYQDANLRGANLAGVNLEQANLKYANLSEATLTNANLKDINLTEVQAVGTDFTSAYLTGACLESWNIDHTTKLDNVDCQYIFLLENRNELGSRERRPHDVDRVFQPGDFTKLYQQVINTAEILLRNGVHRKSFNQAFEQIIKDNPKIKRKGIEKRGEDFLLTLEVPNNTDKAEVEHKFLETYEERLESAIEQARLEGRLEEKNKSIEAITKITMALVNKDPQSSSIIEIYNQGNMEEKTMNKKINQSRNINIENSTVNATGAGSVSQGDMGGTVANNINYGTETTDYSKLDLPRLLTTLKEAIANDSNFPSEDKQDSYDAIDTLTAASQETDISLQKQKAGKALRTLERIVKLLPSGVAFITIFKEISPHIASLLKLF